jgi:cytochrome P450
MTQVSLFLAFRSGCTKRTAELYEDPENFIPDRYLLTENGTKPGVDSSDLRPTLAFGAGRVRITKAFGLI